MLLYFRKSCPLLAAAGALALAGCTNQYGQMPLQDDRGAYNAWTIETAFDSGVRNAIITQRTLYPYHFVQDSAHLNEVGRRDVAVLAAHLARHDGELSIRRGHESDGMYEARVRTVAGELVASGIEPGAVRIVDSFPRGEGMPADQVIRIFERLETSPGLTPAPTGAGATGGGR